MQIKKYDFSGIVAVADTAIRSIRLLVRTQCYLVSFLLSICLIYAACYGHVFNQYMQVYHQAEVREGHTKVQCLMLPIL